MRIQVNSIPEEGLEQSASYDPTKMDMERQDISMRDPIQVKAVFNKADESVVVRADIRAPMRQTCARCLDEFISDVKTDALFSYDVSEDKEVDITEDVRQEVILAYPDIPVCSKTCKGLCKECGHNLNQGTCSHQDRKE